MVFTQISETNKCGAIHKMQHFATHMQHGEAKKGQLLCASFTAGTLWTYNALL